MANKLCEKSVQSPELRTLGGRQLSSGELWGSCGAGDTYSDGWGSWQGWLTTYQVCSDRPTTPSLWGFLFLFFS